MPDGAFTSGSRYKATIDGLRRKPIPLWRSSAQTISRARTASRSGARLVSGATTPSTLRTDGSLDWACEQFKGVWCSASHLLQKPGRRGRIEQGDNMKNSATFRSLLAPAVAVLAVVASECRAPSLATEIPAFMPVAQKRVPQKAVRRTIKGTLLPGSLESVIQAEHGTMYTFATKKPRRAARSDGLRDRQALRG
jgi:hypothetical protein